MRSTPNIADLYDSGGSLREIAELFNTTPPTIAKRLREIGVTIRRPGRPRIPLPLPEGAERSSTHAVRED